MSAAAITARAPTARPGDLLLHPVALAALFVLLLNDHVLKAQFPGLVTGKLSDVAGLVLLPLVLHGTWLALARTGGRVPSNRASRAALAAASVVSAVGFTLIKATSQGNEAYRIGLGVLQWPWHAAVSAIGGAPLPPVRTVELVMDPWDLVALPALLVPVVLARRIAKAREI